MKSELIESMAVDYDGPAILTHVRITLNCGTQYHELGLLPRNGVVDVLRSHMEADEAARWFSIIKNAPITNVAGV